MATANQPNLSDAQLAELEKVARAQDKTVEQVLSAAVDKYLKDQQWQKLTAEAKRRSQGMRPEEIDATVDAAISSYRNEHGR